MLELLLFLGESLILSSSMCLLKFLLSHFELNERLSSKMGRDFRFFESSSFGGLHLVLDVFVIA